jgi:hypothetical protein
MSDTTTIISDPANRPLGKLVENDQWIFACTMANVALAKYDKRSNLTMDMANRVLAKGNVVASYLFQHP